MSKEVLGVAYHPDYLIHTEYSHPERMERLVYITKILKGENFAGHFEYITPEPAAVDDIALIHDRDYISSVKTACMMNRSSLDMDTYIVPESYEIALKSAGGALAGLSLIMEGKYKKVFSLGRPPGHHAEKNRAMGFCLFNNIAIAARVAQEKYNINKVAIIDWDVHHGNGTQNSFYHSKDVLFFSLHQSPGYPGTGSAREIGAGEGEGYTINVPLPGGCGDDVYMNVFEEILLPVLDEYQPELIMISAGQDAYHRDPLAGMHLTYKGYHRMAEALRNAAEKHTAGRILVCMEGGYHLEGQANAVFHAMNSLADWGFPVPNEQVPDKSGQVAARKIRESKIILSNFWKCLK